jgi:hypothetical protein
MHLWWNGRHTGFRTQGCKRRISSTLIRCTECRYGEMVDATDLKFVPGKLGWRFESSYLYIRRVAFMGTSSLENCGTLKGGGFDSYILRN